MFAVRKGNPKNIKTWDDLIKPGVEVITPNPFTSGGAKWNIMAAYGAQLEQGKTEQEARRLPAASCSRTSPVQDKSAREALQTFVGGKGDVLLAYENEAITAQQKGEDVDYVVPDQTILIQNPIAVTTDGEPRRRRTFVDFTRARRGAEDLRREGLPLGDPDAWSTSRSSRRRPACSRSTKLGGWTKVNDEFFDPDKGIVAEIEQEPGGLD